MNAVAYLQFAGNAREALSFYEKALRASKVKFLTFGQMQNPNLSPAEKEMIMDAYLEFDDNVLMLSDVPPFMEQATGKITQGNQMCISIVGADPETNQQYFNRLADGGTVIMPMSDVPWSKSFGMLVDKFGVTWKLNSDARSFIDRCCPSA